MIFGLHFNSCRGVYELFTEEGGNRKYLNKGCSDSIHQWKDPVEAIIHATNLGGSVRMG